MAPVTLDPLDFWIAKARSEALARAMAGAELAAVRLMQAREETQRAEAALTTCLEALAARYPGVNPQSAQLRFDDDRLTIATLDRPGAAAS